MPDNGLDVDFSLMSDPELAEYLESKREEFKQKAPRKKITVKAGGKRTAGKEKPVPKEKEHVRFVELDDDEE